MATQTQPLTRDQLAALPDSYFKAVDAQDVDAILSHFADDRLASSSLILADQITPLPTRDIGGTMFAIGDKKLFLFKDTAARTAFDKDPAKYAKQADVAASKAPMKKKEGS